MVHGLETLKRLNHEAIEASKLPKIKTQLLEMEYPQGLLHLWRFCDESFRYSLDCVQMDFERAIIEATNGRIAVRHSFKVPDEFRHCGKVLLTAESLERVVKYVRRQAVSPKLWLVKRDQEWLARDSKTGTCFELSYGEGRFQNVEAIFDYPLGDAIELTLNMRLLAQFCNAFKGYENETYEPAAYITIPINGSATRWKSYKKPGGPWAEACLMPMGSDCKTAVKVNVKRAVDSWRPATAEDCGRLARFRSAANASFAYGMLVEVRDDRFYCRFSDAAAEGAYQQCEVQE